MAEGSVYKRCSCRDERGGKLGTRCPKLRRPGGAWSPTHGRWGYQLELPTPPGGRRRQLRRTGFASRDAAVAERDHAKALLDLAPDPAAAVAIGDALAAVPAGAPLPDRDVIARRVRAGVPATTAITVGEYLRQWHASRKIEPTTLRMYESHIRRYFQPHLGHLPLDQLRVAHVQAMFDAIAAGGAATTPAGAGGTRTVASATLHRIRATLRKALNDAIRAHRLIEFNPAAHVELPSGTRPKAKVWTAAAVAAWQATGRRPSPVMVWTPEQAGRFLDYAETHDLVLYPMFVLILHRGLRRGEAVGLRDTDADLESGVAVIAQQITTCGHATITKKVKTDAGDRTLALDHTTVTVLRAHHARRARWRLISGPAWPDTGLFFVQPGGQPWHPDTVSDRFDRLVAASGLPPIRLHDLRHCAATYLKAAGADLKDIQATLGHASIAITADTYTSVIHELDSERAKADAAAALIPRTRPAG